LAEAFREIPLRFEPNLGQTDPHVKFVSRQRGFNLFLTGRDAVMVFAPRHSDAQSPPTKSSSAVLRLTLLDGNSKHVIERVDAFASKSNYFLGNDRGQWQANVPNYSRVRYHDVYPGVDLVYYGQEGELEY